MKLKTSFFNSTVLRKDITRFAPLWGLYTVFMLMTVFLIWADETEPARFAATAPNITQAMGFVNFIYAGLCALLLFGDLFQSKMAGMLHAMPMRREGWFLTHFTAGMLFCAVPNTIGAVIACVILQQYCSLAFVWLAVMILQFLFFFSVGAFSAQCAGNKLGAVGIYGLINLLAVLVTFLVVTFYQPVLYGVVIDAEELVRFSPVVNFCMSPYMHVNYDNMQGVALFEGMASAGWPYLFTAVGVGLVFLSCAVVLYCRRHMESAGDLIAFKPAGPVFLVIYTLCVGAAMYFVAEQFNSGADYIFLVLGFAIGFFTGHMLLEKKVNVFQMKKWIGFGAMTVAFFLTIGVATLDPMGITRYVPKQNQVERVHISLYESSYYIDNEYISLTDSQDIMALTDVHKTLVTNRQRNAMDTVTCWLRYYLKDGRTVTRKYYVRTDSSEGRTLKAYYTDFSAVTGADSIEHILKYAESMEFFSHTSEVPNIVFDSGNIEEKYPYEQFATVEIGDLEKSQEVRGLLEAIKADCEAGNMAQQWDFHRNEESVGNLQIVTGNYWALPGRSITVFESCTNTIHYLKSLAEEIKPEVPEQTQPVPQETEPVVVFKD